VMGRPNLSWRDKLFADTFRTGQLLTASRFP
jgi:hypothetical protein